jgi:putative toxin-antitoxin system antitoxin component (TIGR02293 family)
MAAILEVLGGPKAVSRRPVNIQEWVESIRAGLPVASALAFKQALHLTNGELADLLGVNARTVLRWIPGKSKLDVASGDRLVRTAHLFTIAAEVLEDDEAAVRWLRAPQDALGGSVPLELAATDVGTRAVEALLGRMEHGVYT